MRALILAAGLGWRLGEGHPPKSLFEFGGKSLLRRHIELLARQGIDEVIVATGYRHHLVDAELASLEQTIPVKTVFNPDYREGNIVTLWVLRQYLDATDGVVVMDADVLYDERLLNRLFASTHSGCLLLDRNCETDEEPVKVCVKDGHIVEFSKTPDKRRTWDFFGESVGFFRLSARQAKRLCETTELFLSSGRRDTLYEEAIRHLIINDPSFRLGFEDVTGLPWTEIDFYSDLDKARKKVVPYLQVYGPEMLATGS